MIGNTNSDTSFSLAACASARLNSLKTPSAKRDGESDDRGWASIDVSVSKPSGLADTLLSGHSFVLGYTYTVVNEVLVRIRVIHLGALDSVISGE